MNRKSKRIVGEDAEPIVVEPRQRALKRPRKEEPEQDELEILRSKLAAEELKNAVLLKENCRLENSLEETKAALKTQKLKYSILLDSICRMEKDFKEVKADLEAEKEKNKLLFETNQKNKKKSERAQALYGTKLVKLKNKKDIQIKKLTEERNDLKEKAQNIWKHWRSEQNEVLDFQKQLDMRKAEKKKLDDEVSEWKMCDICLQVYSNELERTPRVLGCGHTLCLGCVRELTSENRSTCPFDRSTTEIVGKSIEKMPKNFAVLDMLSILNGSEH